MKRCPRCEIMKAEASFGKDVSTSDGLSCWCRECVREKNKSQYQRHKDKILKRAKEIYDPGKARKKNRFWYQKNREVAIKYASTWSAKNRERRRASARKAYWADPEVFREKNRRYAQENPEVFRAKASLRREAVRQATPPWVDLREIGRFYEEARRLTRETGIQHAVDHIVPLRGKTVCGLHVPWNLEVMTQMENAKKWNKFEEKAA